jgi:hypothetical protein
MFNVGWGYFFQINPGFGNDLFLIKNNSTLVQSLDHENMIFNGLNLLCWSSFIDGPTEWRLLHVGGLESSWASWCIDKHMETY